MPRACHPAFGGCPDRPGDVFLLLAAERLFITLLSVVLGVALLTLLMATLAQAHSGLTLSLCWLSGAELV
ncbi:MAG: hypothetical protein JNK99_06925 [Candidatus Accumulibacter sp.]|uniref:hypothetical protein n=1 Tax=Accumulibacter sp. TaxID=2053492 RepID=UPI001A4DCC13|nr:hypothetical protein [Accumulibacter sp.]MBL8394475.1 hypothetical protein [Accumulibacter sp.]